MEIFVKVPWSYYFATSSEFPKFAYFLAIIEYVIIV